MVVSDPILCLTEYITNQGGVDSVRLMSYREVVMLCSKRQGALQILCVSGDPVYECVKHCGGPLGLLKAGAWEGGGADCEGGMDQRHSILVTAQPYHLQGTKFW